MKRFFAGAVFSCVLISDLYASEISVQKEPVRNQQEVGRYQLFQGQYTTYDLKRQQTSSTSAVFLIDTVTGQVTRYVNKIDEDGKYIESWVPTDYSALDKKK